MSTPTGTSRTGLLRSSRGGFVLAFLAAVLLALAYALPWWRMEARAPQYGMRVLWVNIHAGHIQGDVKEIDGLGHYVGIAPMSSLAPLERMLAPYGLGFAVLCALALPFLRPGWWRTAAGLVVIFVPIGFLLDLAYWQRWAVTHLDPQAPMINIADRMRAQLYGHYQVAQFKVHASFETGFFLVAVAAANALGFLLTEGIRRREPCAASGSRRSSPAAASALLLLVPLGSSETLFVGPGERFASVTEAVGAAAPGDVVHVRAGLHLGHVVIDRPLVLRGEPGAILDGGSKGTVVLVGAGPTTVSGLAIRGSGKSLLAEDAAVKVLDTADCEVSGNRVEDALFGIMARSSPRTVIRGNHVTGKDLPIPRQGDGIRVQNSSGSSIEDNRVERSRDLVIWQSNDCVTRRNHVSGGRYGLHYMYCDDNLFEDNVFEGNQTGGAIMYSRRVTLRGNRFSGSRGPSAYGLLVKVGDDILAEGNRFLDNSSGLFLEDSPSALASSCTFLGNVIAGNEVGISIHSSAGRVTFSENVFVANRRQVESFGRARQETGVWSLAGRGNYWDDYVGFDADGDGLGDTPYRLETFFEDLAERWPAVGLLRMGPASLALETAARAFPVVQPRPLLCDPHPLVRPPAALVRERRAPRGGGLAAAGLAAVLLSIAVVARVRAFGGVA